jgi:hypothetical protein
MLTLCAAEQRQANTNHPGVITPARRDCDVVLPVMAAASDGAVM